MELTAADMREQEIYDAGFKAGAASRDELDGEIVGPYSNRSADYDEMNPSKQENLAPASRIAITVAKAMAERGDDVGPNVTLVLLATIESLEADVTMLRETLDRVDWPPHD